MHVVDAPHLRLLRLLRDEGPISRAELGDRLDLTRPRLLAEVERLVAAGYIAEAGMAASRGGRRSTLVELQPYPFSSRTIAPDEYRATLTVTQ